MDQSTQGFNPDEYLKDKSTPPLNPVDTIQLQQFDPNAYLQGKQTGAASELQDQYGTIPEQLAAGVEGAARGASFGTSDLAESALSKYLPDSIGAEFSPEAIRKRREANPITEFAGNALGSLVPGSAILKGAKALGAGAVAANAALGGAFGAGNAITEAALGDQDTNAGKILAHVGMGAALGGGLGLLGKSIGALPAFMRGIKSKVTGGAEGAAQGGVGALEGEAGQAAQPIVDVPITGKKATSLEELNQQVENYRKYGGNDDLFALPVKQEATEAAQRLQNSMEVPISDYQLDSLNGQDERNAYKVALEVPGEVGTTLRKVTGTQKKILDNVLDNTIKDIAPGYTPTDNALQAGERAADAFTDVIEKNREQLGPAIKAIKEMPAAQQDHLPGVLDYLTNPETSPRANPKIANMFDTTGDSIQLKPKWESNMGITSGTFKRVRDMVQGLKKEPENFESLFDVRKALGDKIEATSTDETAKEITSAKAAMMDYIQDSVQKINPDQAVRDTFAQYARNEEAAKLIESKFGAMIGTNNFRSLAKGKAEEGILRKIFADSATTQAAKGILPKETFQQLLADHLAILKNDVTDKGVMSANKLYSKIAKGTSKYALDEAFLDQPEKYQKLKDLMTVMRTFTDDIPINPSGTAKTILGALKASIEHPTSTLHNALEFGKDFLKDKAMTAEINAKMAGIADQNSKIKTMQTILNKVTGEMTSGAKAIFKSDSLRGGAIGAAVHLSDMAYDKITKRIGDLSSNPDLMMNHMADNTQDLHQAAPQTSQSMSTAMVQAVGFLQSKIPQAKNSFPLSPPFKPTKQQINQFSKYYAAVNNPLEALKQVNAGTLNNETMEALQAVHPQLLSEMRQKVIENMNLEKAKNLDYSKKLSLAKFLGQPLDASMTPQAIQSNQNVFNPPPAAPQPAQKKPRTNLGGLKNLKQAKRTATTTQRDEED